MERIPRKRQYLGRLRSNSCPRSHQTLSQRKPPPKDKRTTPLASKSLSSNLAIIQISLAPLPTKPILPAHYQDSVQFFKSLFRSSSYSTHKFHEFDPRWKQNYTTWGHALEHSHFCKEVYCRYHT